MQHRLATLLDRAGRSECHHELAVGACAQLAADGAQLEHALAERECQVLLERKEPRLGACGRVADLDRLIVGVLPLRRLLRIGLVELERQDEVDVVAARALMVVAVADVRECDAEAGPLVDGAHGALDVVARQRRASGRAAAVHEAIIVMDGHFDLHDCVRVRAQSDVEDAVGDLVRELVGVTGKHGLRDEQSCVAAWQRRSERRRYLSMCRHELRLSRR
jgi:hypothetical protein